jgi:hypothetical protein
MFLTPITISSMYGPGRSAVDYFVWYQPGVQSVLRPDHGTLRAVSRNGSFRTSCYVMYYVELTSRSIPPYKTHLGKYEARRYLESIKVGARCEGVYGGSARCRGVKSRTQGGEHATRHRHVSAQALFLPCACQL